MQEDFLHYLWRCQKFNVIDFYSTNGDPIQVVKTGIHNQDASGPDFFNAQIRIDQQLWAGNIEVHIKSSDWYVHHHETNKAYDNVILHVVWEHDTDVFRKDNSGITTLELKQYVNKEVLDSYYKLFSKHQKWINCESHFHEVDDFIVNNWLERLFFERLERKSKEIEILLKQSANDWEAVLFKMLTKNFGLKLNGDAFLSVANAIDFSIFRKHQNNLLQLEALLFGQSGLLDIDVEEVYVSELQNEYKFLANKYQLSSIGVLPIQFFRLRPNNFPTIRLAQLASLYHKEQSLFSKIINAKNVNDLYELFKVTASPFWETHYTFLKLSKKSKKQLTKSFTDLLIINTIVPLKFCYATYSGNYENEILVAIMKQLQSEKNSIIDKFNALKPISNSAFCSQALLQLKNNYCTKNKCLDCAIGNTLIA